MVSDEPYRPKHTLPTKIVVGTDKLSYTVPRTPTIDPNSKYKATSDQSKYVLVLERYCKDHIDNSTEPVLSYRVDQALDNVAALSSNLETYYCTDSSTYRDFVAFRTRAFKLASLVYEHASKAQLFLKEKAKSTRNAKYTGDIPPFAPTATRLAELKQLREWRVELLADAYMDLEEFKQIYAEIRKTTLSCTCAVLDNYDAPTEKHRSDFEDFGQQMANLANEVVGLALDHLSKLKGHAPVQVSSKAPQQTPPPTATLPALRTWVSGNSYKGAPSTATTPTTFDEQRTISGSNWRKSYKGGVVEMAAQLAKEDASFTNETYCHVSQSHYVDEDEPLMAENSDDEEEDESDHDPANPFIDDEAAEATSDDE